MSEAALQEHVRATCKRLGVLHWHQKRSKGTEAGWPDSFMVGPNGILVRELKQQDPRKGKVTADQQQALDAMAAQGLDTGVWRPEDWFTERIQDEILAVSSRRKAS